MTCPNPQCAKLVPEGAEYCPHCGTKLPTMLANETHQSAGTVSGQIVGVNYGSLIQIHNYIVVKSEQVRVPTEVQHKPWEREEERKTLLIHGTIDNDQILQQVHYTKPKADRVQVPAGARHKLWGREDEVAQAMQVLQEHKTLLIYGMGGIGKTALEAEIAKQLYPSFADGVLWVSEIGQASAGAICDAIARSLGDEEILKLPTEAKLDLTRELLGHKQLLLILDDLAEAATAQAFLSRGLPRGMPLLASSRNRHIGFERNTTIRPLQPKAAIQLFQERAGFASADGWVEQICESLGNHPLALVIAAGRVRAEQMPLASLHRRLKDEKTRLGIFNDWYGRDMIQSIQTSIAASYAELNAEPQKVFVFLAACFGETTGLELLADLCGLSEQDCEDKLRTLMLRSLVQFSNNRFGLHLLVRGFGWNSQKENLDSTQTKVLMAVLNYVRKYGQNIPEHYDKLESELGNLLGAVEFAAKAGLNQTVVSLVDSLREVLAIRGYWNEWINLGKLGIEATKTLQDDWALSRLLHNTGIALQEQGNYSEPHEFYQQSLEIEKKLGNQSGIASSLHQLGMIAQQQDNYPEAQQLYQQSLEINRKLGDQSGIANNLGQLGNLTFVLGRVNEARILFEQALEIFERLNSPYAEITRQNLQELDQKQPPGEL